MTERDNLQPSEESSLMEDSDKSRELEEATHEPGVRVEESGDIKKPK